MKLPNRVYDLLKWLCLIVMPALAYGYGELAKIWGWAYQTEIPSTINLIAFVIGVCIGVSTLNYNREQAELLAGPVSPDGDDDEIEVE